MLLQTHSGDIRKPATNREVHAFRGAVAPHEKLLLLATLAVVTAWIAYRAVPMLFGAIG